MKKKICAVLLSLCSVIGGAERKSDASIVGKTLKYGSAIVGSLDTLRTLGHCYYWCKFYDPKKLNPYKVYYGDLPNFLWPNKETEIDMHGLIFGTVLGDLISYGGYKLGQHLDKDSEKEKSRSKNGGNNSSNGTGSNNPKDVRPKIFTFC